MTSDASRPAEMKAAIDRCGADLAVWQDRARANAVRAAALADRDLRAWLDDAAALDAALRVARDDIDAEIAGSGSVARVTARVLAATGGRARRGWWVPVAAALVLAAALGSLMDFGFFAPEQRPFDVVVVDPLVFGPTEAGSQ